MDISNLKYNRELIKKKNRLEKELKMINKEIENQQENCDHIWVYFGKSNNDNSRYRCVLCNLDWNSKESVTVKFPYINVSLYKSSLLSEYDEEKCFDKIQEQFVKTLIEDSELTQYEIIDRINKYLEEESVKNHEKMVDKVKKRTIYDDACIYQHLLRKGRTIC